MSEATTYPLSMKGLLEELCVRLGVNTACDYDGVETEGDVPVYQTAVLDAVDKLKRLSQGGQNSASSVSVIAPGTRVKLGTDEAIVGTVQAVQVREGGSVSYECVWWSGRTRNETWCDAGEVTQVSDTEQPMRIGFGQKGKPTMPPIVTQTKGHDTPTMRPEPCL